MSKTLHSFDRLTGASTGPVVFTDEDMGEQEYGPWVAPANTLETAPPEGLEAHQFAAARAGVWVICDLPGAEPVVEQKTTKPRRKVA